jgi:hypothetical protein
MELQVALKFYLDLCLSYQVLYCSFITDTAGAIAVVVFVCTYAI